jgi:cell division protein FtsL
MIELGPFLRATLALVALVASLWGVTWRQSRALEAMSALDEIRRQTSLAEAERVDLECSIQVLESRARVVPEARERLGMHIAAGTELVILPGEAKP